MIIGGVPSHAEFRITADDLRLTRRSRGWSQADLAERLGVSRSTVQAWERGSRETPTMLTLALIGLDAVEPEFALTG